MHKLQKRLISYTCHFDRNSSLAATTRKFTYSHPCKRDTYAHFLVDMHRQKKRPSLSGYVCDSFMSTTIDRERSGY